MPSQPTLRFTGLVRIARFVQEQLRQGIPENRTEEFRSTVRRNIEIVEQGCQRVGLKPANLPGPSRNAYIFLKGINLDRLPVRQGEASAPGRVRISNVIRGLESFHATVNQLAASEGAPKAADQIMPQVKHMMEGIERILENAGQGPDALEKPTGRAYALLKFLSEPGRLEAHVATVKRFRELSQPFCVHCPNCGLEVTMGNGSHIYAARRTRTRQEYQLYEGFLGAEDAVLGAILDMVHRDKPPKARQILHEYQESESFSDVADELETILEPPSPTTRGRSFDLEEIFSSINQRFFGGQVPRPRLRWSSRLTSRKFGHYRFATDEVMISSTLDFPLLPRYLVEFVMYHELLHKKHRARFTGGKMAYHTPEFRQEEQRFPDFWKIEQELEQLARTRQQSIY